ncbi:hypothetical protein OF83DRAFT_1125259 [Amylostereum chailletii]|nr:hypothetical protein OF83DRAFT_1125259 [Amylostereum chailletii]
MTLIYYAVLIECAFCDRLSSSETSCSPPSCENRSILVAASTPRSSRGILVTAAESVWLKPPHRMLLTAFGDERSKLTSPPWPNFARSTSRVSNVSRSVCARRVGEDAGTSHRDHSR